MASKILVDELAPYSHATDVTLATGKKIAGANTQFKITGGANLNHLQTDGAGNVTWVAPASAGSMVLLLDAPSVSAVASYTVDSTYINSTYDDYFVVFDALPVTDSVEFYVKAIVGGSVVTATNLAYETQRVGGAWGGANVNSTNIFASCSSAIMGNATGEGINGSFFLHNVNSTTRPCGLTGLSNWAYIDADRNASTFAGSFRSVQYADVLNGLNFIFSSGNIQSAMFKIYGITT